MSTYYSEGGIIPLNKLDLSPFREPDGTNNIFEKYDKKLFVLLIQNKDKKRKQKQDNIRKNIKVSFLKILRGIINTGLENAFSKYLFEQFSQYFVTDITIQTNSEAMGLTYEEIFDFSYFKYKYLFHKNEKAQKVVEKKREKNEKALAYLNSEENKQISIISGWNKIKKMNYGYLLKMFFLSKEFEESIKNLELKEEEKYIIEYINIAKNYLDFYQYTNIPILFLTDISSETQTKEPEKKEKHEPNVPNVKPSSAEFIININILDNFEEQFNKTFGLNKENEEPREISQEKNINLAEYQEVIEYEDAQIVDDDDSIIIFSNEFDNENKDDNDSSISEEINNKRYFIQAEKSSENNNNIILIK